MKTLSLLFSFLLFVRARSVAVNEVDARESAVLVAANSLAMASLDGDVPEEEWLQVCPYGEFPNIKGKQIVTRRQANDMVAAFNSMFSRLGRFFRGVPVYVGHPDVMPDRYPDERRIGKVNALDAREDGLYARVAWNDLGRQNRQQGYHVYPSPAWLFPKRLLPNVVPDELLSIGLTNTPQITEVVPWTANSKPPGPGTTQENTMDRNLLIRLLGLAATATDQEIETAVNSAIAGSTDRSKLIKLLGLAADATGPQLESAVNAKLTEITDLTGQLGTANTRVTTLEGEVRTSKEMAVNARSAHAKVLLDAAITAGRLTQAERGEYETAFNSDFDAAATRLAAKPPALNTREITLGDRKASIATAKERSAIIDAAVNERMTKGEDYDTAYNAVAKDPAYTAVFAAMAKSTSEANLAATA